MGQNDITLSMSMPLDSEGFLRRQCPTCEREFKWLHTASDPAEPQVSTDSDYFCPYCGIQAPANSWFTEAQVARAQNLVATEVVGPMIKKFSDDIRRSFRSSLVVQSNGTHTKLEQLDPLTEEDDMLKISFTCHPTEPVKIIEDWDKAVHCLICGALNN